MNISPISCLQIYRVSPQILCVYSTHTKNYMFFFKENVMEFQENYEIKSNKIYHKYPDYGTSPQNNILKGFFNYHFPFVF